MTRKNDRKRKLAKAGPVRPPSTWPLDHIPEPVLHIIIEYLADSARDFQPGGASSVFRTTCLGSDPVVPLTSDLKNLSMVSAHIRQMVMAKHIAHTVVLGSAWHILGLKNRYARKLLGRSGQIIDWRSRRSQTDPDLDLARTHRQIVFVQPSDQSQYRSPLPDLANMLWRSHRKAFIESCVKLERIVDQTGEMTYSSHPCPPSLHDPSMRLLSGTRMPAPIEAMGLKKVRLSLDHSAHLEGTGSLEAAMYREKLGALLRITKKLDKLELQLPGLPAAPPLPVEDVPPHLWTNDPLPATLRTIGVLELDVTFCTVEDGSPREAAWYAYLRWVLDTKPKFTQLDVHMTWDETFVAGHAMTPRGIFDSMGLVKVRQRDDDGKSYVPGRETMSQCLRDFVGFIFDGRPELEKVQLKCLAIPPTWPGMQVGPEMFRHLVGTRYPHGAILFEDVIGFELVDKLVGELYTRSTPDIHGDRSRDVWVGTDVLSADGVFDGAEYMRQYMAARDSPANVEYTRQVIANYMASMPAAPSQAAN